MTALRAASMLVSSHGWAASPRSVGRAMTTSSGPGTRTPAGKGDTSAKEWMEPYLQAPQAGPPVHSGLTARQRRIMFRSRQRGCLELDVLLGSWASRNVPAMMDERDIEMVEELLTLETPHLYKWIINQDQPPHEIDNKILRSLQEFARGPGMVEER